MRAATLMHWDVIVPAIILAERGVVLTGDPDDLVSLAAPYPNITVQPLPGQPR